MAPDSDISRKPKKIWPADFFQVNFLVGDSNKIVQHLSKNFTLFIDFTNL